MAGGKGERLWPLVNAQMPKVCLSPDGSRSLIQQTIDRLKPVAPDADWLIVTTPGQEAPIRQALKMREKIQIIVEPQGKNTAACIMLAAAAASSHDLQRILVAVPADHWMGDVSAFQRAMRAAIASAAKRSTLVMIGIPPKGPHTGLGYLCTRPASHGEKPAIYALERFIEKPALAKAKRLSRRPGVFWNSGMFIGKAGCFIGLISQRLPNHSRLLSPLAAFFAQGKQGSTLFRRTISAAYKQLKNISFDHGVMQHVKDALVVDGQFGWEDLGSWDIWAQLGQGTSRTVLIDSENISVIGEADHLVAAIGMRDVVVVQAPNATLICRPGRAQEVRAVVRRLASQRRLARYL